MESVKNMKNPWFLSVRSVTWYKNSHSLFDYESNKITTHHSFYPTNAIKSLVLHRKRQGSQVSCTEEKAELLRDPEEYQCLTKFRLDQSATNKFMLQFFSETVEKTKELSSQRVKTDESKGSDPKEEETYIVVRKQKDSNGEPKGYKLEPGQTIKLGRVEFFVSEVSIDGKVQKPSANSKHKRNINQTVFKYKPLQKIQEGEEKRACKICLEEAESTQDFLFNPCKCAGSCGTVHLQCLLQWISIKVKKQVVGGTNHYNFQKFECQVCKTELPIRVQTENKVIELLPIDKPTGNYVILEGACEKTKSVMMIQNVPNEGIKLGRGHDCEIRITDISVSRNHALIKFLNGAFHVFDNKSKFGTLVKDERMEVAVTPEYPQAIQIGRTVVILELKKENDLKERVKSNRNNQERLQYKFAQGSRKNIERR